MRREDWPERLAEYVEAAREVPFAWGLHDCGTFAVGAIEAVTGTRHQIPLAVSAAAYAHMLRDHGTLHDMTTAMLGTPIPCAYARRGDIVMIAIDGRECLAVCLGASAAAPGDAGLLMVPMRAATAAWAV